MDFESFFIRQANHFVKELIKESLNSEKPRRDFSKSTMESTKFLQGYVCNRCKQPTDLWEFHHKDWNRSNNRPSNCEALCPNCHAKKTRKKKKKLF